MILPCLCYKRLSHNLSPSSEASLCRRRKKESAQGTMGRGTPLPVVHNALTKTQAESLRRGECNRLVFRVFEFPRLLPIMIREEKGNRTPLKTIFYAVEVSKVIQQPFLKSVAANTVSNHKGWYSILRTSYRCTDVPVSRHQVLKYKAKSLVPRHHPRPPRPLADSTAFTRSPSK